MDGAPKKLVREVQAHAEDIKIAHGEIDSESAEVYAKIDAMEEAAQSAYLEAV